MNTWEGVSVRPSVRLSVRPSVRPSFRPSVCPYVTFFAGWNKDSKRLMPCIRPCFFISNPFFGWAWACLEKPQIWASTVLSPCLVKYRCCMYTRFLLLSVDCYCLRLKEKCDKKVSINNNVNVYKENCINIIFIHKKSASIFYEIGKILIKKTFWNTWIAKVL